VTLSVRQIGAKLGVDSMTVKRHAAKSGLAFPRAAKRVAGKGGPPKVSRSPVPHDSSLRAKQEEWLETKGRYPDDGVTDLRKRIPACYA
jgi:hypothetical protein